MLCFFLCLLRHSYSLFTLISQHSVSTSLLLFLWFQFLFEVCLNFVSIPNVCDCLSILLYVQSPCIFDVCDVLCYPPGTNCHAARMRWLNDSWATNKCYWTNVTGKRQRRVVRIPNVCSRKWCFIPSHSRPDITLVETIMGLTSRFETASITQVVA